jgi:hypothetical protein
VEEEVQDAVKFADESPETRFETMMATVYATNRGDL